MSKEVTVTYKVFKFSELSKEAKEKALSDWNVNNDNWCYDLKYFINEGLKEYGLLNGFKNHEDVFFCLFVQGEYVELKDPIIDDSEKFFDMAGISKRVFVRDLLYDFIKFSSWRNGGNYLELDYFCDYDNRYPRLMKLINNEFLKLESFFSDILHGIKNQIYAEYEYQHGEENFAELCEANEYTFLENGEMFNV